MVEFELLSHICGNLCVHGHEEKASSCPHTTFNIHTCETTCLGEIKYSNDCKLRIVELLKNISFHLGQSCL